MIRPVKHPKSGVYRLRKAIPAPLRPLFDGKCEIIENLDTKDHVEAKRLAPPIAARMEAQVAAALALHKGQHQALTQRDISAICGDWYRSQVAAHEASPGDPTDWDGLLDHLSLDHQSDPERAWEDPEISPSSELRAEARDFLLGQGIATDAESLSRFAVGFWHAKVKLCQTMRRRAGGDYSPNHVLDTFASPAETFTRLPNRQKMAKTEAALTGAQLLEAWSAERKPSPATLRKYRTAFAQVARSVGFDDIQRLRPEDVVAFKAARLANGRNPGTVADDILACGTVCKWGVTNKLLAANPFAGLAPKPTQRGERARDGYTDDEAARILAAARQEVGWLRWLPWLLCFTGARISEIVDMRRQDIRCEAGVWILDIRPNAARAGKNPIFERMVPIHPAVVREGILDYVQSLPQDPYGPLFPDLTAAQDGTRTIAATSAAGRWIRGVVGITDKRKAPNHSWRHRIEDELRKVRALPEVQDAITGRKNPRNAGAGYGKGFRGMPEEVLKDLSRVPSPLDVPNAVCGRHLSQGLK